MNETDKEKLAKEFADWLTEPNAWPPNENQVMDWFISKIDHLIREGKEERTIEILAKVESATTAKEARHIIKDFLK